MQYVGTSFTIDAHESPSLSQTWKFFEFLCGFLNRSYCNIRLSVGTVSVKYGNIEFPGGGIPGNSGWGWGVSLGCPNPSPISVQKLSFFTPIFRPGPGSSKDG